MNMMHQKYCLELQPVSIQAVYFTFFFTLDISLREIRKQLLTWITT